MAAIGAYEVTEKLARVRHHNRGGKRAAGELPSPFVRGGLQAFLLLGTLIALDLITNDPAANPDTTLDRLAWLTTVQLVLQLLILTFTFGSALTPPVIFSALLSLFTSGWLILRTTQVSFPANDVLSREMPSSIASAAEFYLTAFPLFGLGVVLFAGSGRARPPVRLTEEVLRRRALSRVGAACVVIGVVPFVVSNVHNLRVVLTSGYSTYYDPGSRLASPLLILGYYFIVGLIFLAVSGESTRARKIAYVLGTIGLVRLIAGDRGEGFIYLLSTVLLWRTLGLASGKRSGRVGIAAFASLAVVVIPAIGTLRHAFGEGGVNLGQAFLQQNPIVETLRTMGGTLFPLVKVMEAVPTGQEVLWGGSYFSGVLRLLPSSVLPYSLGRLVEDPLYASPATWLMEQLSMTYGPGFTPFAEAYLNFGEWGGAVALFVFGVVATLALRLPTHSGVFRVAFVLTAFALCGFTVRGSSNFLVPALVRFVLIPLAAAFVLAPSLKSRQDPSD